MKTAARIIGGIIGLVLMVFSVGGVITQFVFEGGIEASVFFIFLIMLAGGIILIRASLKKKSE